METIKEKYARLRPKMEDGDLILFHGTGLLARIIQWCDKSYYNHVGVVFRKLSAMYIVDSNESGVQADRLSMRIEKYKNGDFSLVKPLRPDKEIQYELYQLLKRSDDKWIRYDFYNGAKELANRAFGWNLKITLDENRDICSDFVSDYMIKLGMLNEDFKKVRIAFPQDIIRYKTEFVLVID